VREVLGSVSAGLDTLSQREILSKEYEWTGQLTLRVRPEDAYTQENVTLRTLNNYRFTPATAKPANERIPLLGAIVPLPVHIFDSAINPQNLEYAEGDSVVTMKNRSAPTFAIGIGRFTKGKVEWRVKIEKFKKDPIFFGVITNSAFHEKKNDEYLVSMSPSYAWPTNFGWTTRDLMYTNGVLQSGQGYRGDIKTGDIIELELDCDNKTLTSRFPRINHPFHLKLPPLEPHDSWRFHVNMAGSNDCLRILDPHQKDPKDPKDPKDQKDPKDSKDPKDHKDHKDQKDQK